MEKYLFSPTQNAFYPYSLKEEYLVAGSWPIDGVDVGEDIFEAFTCENPSGKLRVADKEGYPSWGDVPPLTHEESVSQAESTKNGLVLSAKQVISIWQSELLLGTISEQDKAKLSSWIAYIKSVLALDTANFPDITWPEKPEK